MGRYSATYDVIAGLSSPVHTHSDLKQQFLGVFGVPSPQTNLHLMSGKQLGFGKSRSNFIP
jgi:hypothetical protein